MSDSTAIIARSESGVSHMPSADSASFELLQREAKLFSASPLIPDHLRKGGPEQATANCYIALKMARTMGEDPLVVLQNIHIVSGKAGFASQYMIARANSSGVFKGRINWRVEHRNTDKLSVTAFATLADSEEVVEFTCDMAMARAEQWTRNPKYKSMPEVMLRYRSAAFLVRFYAPDVMLGYHTAEEWTDVAAAGKAGPVIDHAPSLTGDMLREQAGETIEQVEEAEVEEIEQEADQEPEEAASEPEAEPTPAEVAAQTVKDIDGPLEGEGEGDDAPNDAAEAKAKEIIEAIDKSKTVVDLRALREREDSHIKSMPDETASRVKRAFKDMDEALRRGADK